MRGRRNGGREEWREEGGGKRIRAAAGKELNLEGGCRKAVAGGSNSMKATVDTKTMPSSTTSSRTHYDQALPEDPEATHVSCFFTEQETGHRRNNVRKMPAALLMREESEAYDETR